MATETELKLTAPARVLRALPNAAWLRAMQSGPAKKEKLVSIYFDTPDCRLQRNGAALRVRRKSGRRLQTIKTENGGLSRDEWEQPIAGNTPDLDAAEHTPIAPLLKGRAKKSMRPIFETDIERTIVPLRAGVSHVELALDRGFIRAGKRRETVHEIELELKDGEPRDLAELAEKCAKAWDVAFGAQTKAERGYALSAGTTGKPVTAGDILLTADETIGAAFTKIGLSCLHHLSGNEIAVRKGYPEGVHQMRVGLRRLRAAISVFKSIARDERTESIKDELKWLTEQLGPARDLDVLVEDAINPLHETEPKRREIEILKTDVQERRDEGFAKAKAAVENARYRELVLRTALWLIAGSWSQKKDPLTQSALARRIGDFAPEVLDKRTKKIAKKTRKADELDAHARHKLRISVKKLRYSTEFFASLFAKEKHRKASKRFEELVKALQDALGKLHDIAVHERFAGDMVRLGRCTKKELQKAYAMGLLSGSERRLAGVCIADVKKTGRKLADAKTFWR